jgi:DNA-binding GntR family transcriptional regulator
MTTHGVKRSTSSKQIIVERNLTNHPVKLQVSGAARGNSVSATHLKLKQLIVEGQIAPGSWIVEGQLALSLGLSRTPVRCALQLLQREGFITEYRTETKSRMRVTALTSEDAAELYRIVGHLEGLAGVAAAKLPVAKRTELKKDLIELNRKLSDVAKSKDVKPRLVFELDTQFHAALVRASSGPKLIMLHEIVKPQIERYWRLYAHTIIKDLPKSVSEHDDIISAIAKGNARAAERAIETNWKYGAERIGRLIQIFGEHGSF